MPVAAAKVDGWKLDGDHLTCYVYDAQKRKSKKDADFIAVKHNGQVNGKDVAFCFHEKLFDALIAAKGKHCVLFVGPADFTTIEDVCEVDGQEFRDGQPYTKPAEQTTFAATDDDIPF